jgi:hypothetical protein
MSKGALPLSAQAASQQQEIKNNRRVNPLRMVMFI